MASVWKVLEIICYLMLLFFMVPIKIENDPKLQNFLNYARDFNKSYVDKEMFNVRFDTFKKSLEQIEMFNENKTKSSARYGLTSFTDFFPYSVILPIKTNLTKLFELQEHWGPIPNKVDWRRKNAITNVKNQKDCGSCWAFSVIETIESMAAIKTKKLREFSVQQSVDCSVENWGCQGGDMCSLAHWIVMNNVSVMLEQDYPYTGSNQSCQMKKTFTGVYISKYSCGSLIGAEDAILSYLAFKGPLAVALNVNSWQNYVGGVIQFHCDSNYTNLNHSAQIVGYDLSGDIPYYIVRNSWGKQYGDKGYVYIAVGSNMCGIVNKVLSLDVL